MLTIKNEQVASGCRPSVRTGAVHEGGRSALGFQPLVFRVIKKRMARHHAALCFGLPAAFLGLFVNLGDIAFSRDRIVVDRFG